MINKIFYWVKIHRYCLAGLYLFVFLLGFLILELVEPTPRYMIHCVVDDWIPFHEYFVIPYFIWYLWVPVFMIYFMITDRDSYLRFLFVMLGGATICLLIYAVFPNGLNLRQEITADNPCAWLVKLLRQIDPPCNVCPSLHVSSTVAVHVVLCKNESYRNNRGLMLLSGVVTVLICISTMFIKQHSFVDVVCGAVLTACMSYVSDFIFSKESAKDRLFFSKHV